MLKKDATAWRLESYSWCAATVVTEARRRYSVTSHRLASQNLNTATGLLLLFSLKRSFISCYVCDLSGSSDNSACTALSASTNVFCLPNLGSAAAPSALDAFFTMSRTALRLIFDALVRSATDTVQVCRAKREVVASCALSMLELPLLRSTTTSLGLHGLDNACCVSNAIVRHAPIGCVRKRDSETTIDEQTPCVFVLCTLRINTS